MVSKPPFVIEIEKGGETLALSCAFTEDIADPSAGDAQYGMFPDSHTSLSVVSYYCLDHKAVDECCQKLV